MLEDLKLHIYIYNHVIIVAYTLFVKFTFYFYFEPIDDSFISFILDLMYILLNILRHKKVSSVVMVEERNHQ